MLQVNPVVLLATPLLHESEGFYRLDKASGAIKAYADPASPLARAIQKRGQWLQYLDCKFEPGLSMSTLKGDPWTIGFGSTGAHIKADTVWTRAQCEAQFNTHVNGFLTALMKLVGGLNLKPHQLAALLSLMYNIGETAFRKSTLLRLLLSNDELGAANQFLRWNKAGGQVLHGLTVRRRKERALFLNQDVP